MRTSARASPGGSTRGAGRPLVLINGSPLWPPVTGVQRVARGLAARLLQEADGAEVRIVGGPSGRYGTWGILATRAARAGWEQAVLPVLARAARVVLNLGNLAPLAARNTLVLTYDLHALRHPDHYRGAWGRPYWTMAASAYRRARFRVTLSRTIADDLESTLGHHVDLVLPPGIDDAFRPAPPDEVAAIRRRLGLTGPYLTVVGWAQPGKRAPLALAAHDRVVRDVPHQLVLVGAARPDFAPVSLERLSSSVIMPGRLSDRDLAALHSGSSGLLFSTVYEGFGLPPVEALACGAPVASSRLPITEEVLSELAGVRFVEGADPASWADAAVALLCAPDSTQDRWHRSEATRARYPWEGKGRALLDLVLG